MATSPFRIGIDVGGTFTDLVLFDPAAGTVRLAKTPTTPENQATGVLAALAEAQVELAEVDVVVHGTTTTTNAVLERRLARTGLITTQGFRDVLELGRRTRPHPYGHFTSRMRSSPFPTAPAGRSEGVSAYESALAAPADDPFTSLLQGYGADNLARPCSDETSADGAESGEASGHDVAGLRTQEGRDRAAHDDVPGAKA